MQAENRKSLDGNTASPQHTEISGLDRRLAYLELSQPDRDRLRELSGYLDGFHAEFVDIFYRHLFAFDETARFLQNAQLVDRLKGEQLSHLASMLEAEWSEEYIDFLAPRFTRWTCDHASPARP